MLQAKSIAEFGRSDFESIAEGTADDIRIVSGQIHEGLMSKTHDVPRPCQLPHSCFAVTTLEASPWFRWVRCPMWDVCH